MATKILLVEDDPALQRLYVKILTQASYEYRLANNGVAIVEKALSEAPDLIIMDVMMPERNGMKALADLKNNDTTKNIPVIMLSAYQDDELLFQAMQLGAKRYLVKSMLEPSQVLDIVKETLLESASTQA